MKKHFIKDGGYVAITSAIVLSLVIFIVGSVLGSYSFLTRFNVVDFDNKQGSLSLARSCLDIALLKLANDSTYAGSETFSVDQYQCAVRPIQTSGGNKIIESRAQLNGATTNLKLTVDAFTLSTASLEELVKF